MASTKPFNNREWIIVLITGIFLTTFGFVFIAKSVLSSNYDMSSIYYGIFFGMGMTDLILSGSIRQYEKKLAAKNALNT